MSETVNEQEQETFVKWRMFNLSYNGIQSNHDDSGWTIGVTRSVNTEYSSIATCKYGFHCSDNIALARDNIGGNVVAKVEVSGENSISSDKSAWEHMTILQAWQVPNSDGINARMHAMVTSEKWGEHFPEAMNGGFGRGGYDIDCVDDMEEGSNSYLLHAALQYITAYVPSHLVEEAYAEFVTSFPPLTPVPTHDDTVATEINDKLGTLYALKASHYEPVQAQTMITLANELSGMLWNMAYATKSPVTRGESSFSPIK